MASTAQGQVATVDVKVLSQLSGTDHQQLFTELPANTTVADLKAKLAAALSSRPPADHQRLIYRGRLLARDGEALGDIFGKDSTQPHIVHLVVREAVASRSQEHRHPHAPTFVPHAAPTPPEPAVALPAQVIAQPRHFVQHAAPNLAQIPHAQPNGPIVHPQTPFDALNARNHGFRQTVSQGLLPQHLQQHFDHLRIHQPGAAFGNMYFGDPRHPVVHQGQPVQPQQAIRVSQGDTSTANPPTSHSPHRQPSSQGHAPSESSNGPAPAHGPSITDGNMAQHAAQAHAQPPNSNVRYATGPNGEIVSVTYSMSSAMPSMGNQQYVPQLPNSMPQRVMQPTSSRPHLPNWPNMPPLGTSSEFYGTGHAIDSMQLYHDDLARLRDRLSDHVRSNPGAMPQQGIAGTFRAQVQNILRMRNRAQQMINDLLLPGRYPYHNGLGTGDVSRLQHMNALFTSTFNLFLREVEYLERGAASVGPGGEHRQEDGSEGREGRPSTRATTAGTPITTPVTAYLLNAPSGPQAIVFNPTGTFDSHRNENAHDNTPDPIFQQLRSIASSSRLHRTPQERIEDRVARARDAVSSLNRELAGANEALNAASSAVQNMHNTNAANARSARGDQPQEARQVEDAGEDPAQPQPAPAQAQAQPQAGHEINDFGNVVFQAVWHLWTAIRLFAFIYLFTRGMSTRRTVLLVVAGIIYLAAQVGIFGDQLSRLRRHFENLLGLPQLDEPVRPNQQPPVQQPRDPNVQRREQANAGQRPLPNPQAVADRLLQARRDQDRSWLTQRLIPVERAVALFVASLYPGVGERHVQARERHIAEQRRQEEEAERARSEAEAQPQQQIQGPPSTVETSQAQEAADVGHAVTQPSASATGAGSSSAVQASEGVEALRERTPASQASAAES